MSSRIADGGSREDRVRQFSQAVRTKTVRPFTVEDVRQFMLTKKPIFQCGTCGTYVRTESKFATRINGKMAIGVICPRCGESLGIHLALGFARKRREVPDSLYHGNASQQNEANPALSDYVACMADVGMVFDAERGLGEGVDVNIYGIRLRPTEARVEAMRKWGWPV